MKKLLVYILIIGAVCLMGGCVDKEVKKALSDISLLLDDEQPDSALALLDSLQSLDLQLGYHERMLCRLYRLNAYNKLDTVFHSIDEANVLVEYFDDSGTPNERMLAHYLQQSNNRK